MEASEAKPVWSLARSLRCVVMGVLVGLWLAVLLSHVLMEWPPFDTHFWDIFGRVGVAGVIGFWVSFGGGRWWVRLPLAALAVWLLVAGKTGEAQVIVPLCMLGTAGASFLASMALSLGSGKPGRQFSILHAMGATALVAVSIGILQTAAGAAFFSLELWRLSYALTFLSVISCVMALECLTLLVPWGWKRVAAGLGVAILMLGVSLFDYLIRSQVLDFNNSMSETLTYHTVYAVTLWLTLLPLEAALAAFGLSVVAKRWRGDVPPAGQAVPDGGGKPA